MPDSLHPRLSRLPGWELIEAGLGDCAAGRITPAGCLVRIAAPRLQRAGLLLRSTLPPLTMEPELQLYRLLRQESGNAYGRYQALLRRLVRFEHALDRELYLRRRRHDELAVAEE